jgi:hypothetical protein
MYLFIDESECRNSQRYYVGGLLCSEVQVCQVAEALTALARDFEEDLCLPVDGIELHGYEICHAKKQWKPLEIEIQKRIDLYLSAVTAINLAGVSFFMKPVRQKRLAIRGDHEMALLYLLEEVDRRCEGKGLPKGSVRVICDKINIQTEIQNSYILARVNSTRGWKPRKLEWLGDRLLFEDSRDHRLIQAVDLLLFAHCRKRFFEYQIADGAMFSTKKKRELKALRRICDAFESITNQLPMFEPTPFRGSF